MTDALSDDLAVTAAVLGSGECKWPAAKRPLVAVCCRWRWWLEAWSGRAQQLLWSRRSICVFQRCGVGGKALFASSWVLLHPGAADFFVTAWWSSTAWCIRTLVLRATL